MGVFQDKLLEERLLQLKGDRCIITLPAMERETGLSSVVQRPKYSYEFCTQRLKAGFYHYSALLLHAEKDMLIVASPSIENPSYTALLFVIEHVERKYPLVQEPVTANDQHPTGFSLPAYARFVVEKIRRFVNPRYAVDQQSTPLPGPTDAQDVYTCRLPTQKEMRLVEHLAVVGKLSEEVPVSSRYL